MTQLRHLSSEHGFSLRELGDTTHRFDLANDVLEQVMQALPARPPQHLFVTLLDGHEIVAMDSAGVGLYMDGIMHAAVAAAPPDAIPADEFDAEFIRTLAHEAYHFYQEYAGSLGSEEAENAAEEFSEEFLAKYQASK